MAEFEGNPRPRLIVFDLDFTLWDCGGTWVDCTSPPYRRHHTDREMVEDAAGRKFRVYPEVQGILERLEAEGIVTALASRTSEPEWAAEVLELFGLRERFAHREIYPGSKVGHFAAFQSATGLEYEEMLFFDDEQRNIDDVSALGVKCVLVRNGMSLAQLDHGLESFAAVIL